MYIAIVSVVNVKESPQQVVGVGHTAEVGITSPTEETNLKYERSNLLFSYL